MSRLLVKLVAGLAIVAAGCLAAGCGGGSIKSALSSAAASRSVTISPPTVSRPTLSPPTRSPRTRPPAPATEPATSPTTEPATTAPPTTAPPTTPPPTTAPVTPPSSAVTSKPAVTKSAAAPAPSPSPQSPVAVSASPAASESGSSLLWLWILLGVLAVVIVAVLIARRSGHQSAAAANWRSKVVDVYAKGSALYDAMSAAQAPGAQAAGDAAARWADIQRRADDLSQDLYALRESAPGEAEGQRVADVLSSLQAVRSASMAERAPGAVGPPLGTRVPGLLQAFEASLRALHPPGEHGGPP